MAVIELGFRGLAARSPSDIQSHLKNEGENRRILALTPSSLGIPDVINAGSDTPITNSQYFSAI